MDNNSIWMNLISKHWGKIIGGLLGLIIGIIFLNFGFLKTIFLLFIVTVGIYLGGRQLDGNSDLKSFFDDLWPSGRNR